ncbi:hypothetical protein L208DRAFT_839493 [Tricholoma matsutake]|nr:hypothetical protein L208DRAFT_839493 [Tricholoma matsutake 945]
MLCTPEATPSHPPQLGLPPSTIETVVGDPSHLASPLGLDHQLRYSSLTTAIGKVYRILFILHACLAALAMLTSIIMIKHKPLTRNGESQSKSQPSSSTVEGANAGSVDNQENLHGKLLVNPVHENKAGIPDIEMSTLTSNSVVR